MSAQTFLPHHRLASRTTPDALVPLLCDRHAPALYRLALILLGDPDLAERAVVDALTAAVHTRSTATVVPTTNPRRFAEDRFELVDAVCRRCLRADDHHEARAEPCDSDRHAIIGLIVLGTRRRDPHA